MRTLGNVAVREGSNDSTLRMKPKSNLTSSRVEPFNHLGGTVYPWLPLVSFRNFFSCSAPIPGTSREARMQTYEHRKISAPEAAAYLGISASTLSELRVFGGGPKFHQLGRRSSMTFATSMAGSRRASARQHPTPVPRQLRIGARGALAMLRPLTGKRGVGGNHAGCRNCRGARWRAPVGRVVALPLSDARQPRREPRAE